ncbi:MAG: YoaP domain-containing protein [Spirochaetes bacterium]|nr:YoaP domain-containing protein [Spirochaetota bacterium]
MAANRNDIQIIDLTPENIARYGVCGYKDIHKHRELQRKVDWVKRYYPKGLRIKALISKSGGYQGMLEYIPGEYAHRPVNAEGYMFIHCLFVGFKKEFKGKGFASMLLDECITDAKKEKMHGAAVITREGSFMAKKDIFIKKGFSLIDTMKPDFELLVFKFNDKENDPKFVHNPLEKYSNGLTIMRSPQCPYSVKNVEAIIQTANTLELNPELIEMNDYESAQKSPCAFGTFCIINKGKIVSHHPISNTRFENIMKTEKKINARTNKVN